MQYALLLKNNTTRQYRLLAVIVAIVHAFIFLILLVSPNTLFVKTIAGTGIAAMAINLLCGLYNFDRVLKWFNRNSVMYILLILIWTLLGNYWIIPLLLGILILNGISLQPLTVRICAEKIEYPSIPKKIILWKELDNVIVKDRLLTIDFKNDKLFQAEIIAEQGFDETAFNESIKPFLKNGS
jgi:hypothetical protein